MAEKIWNADIASIDTAGNKLTIKQRRFQAGKLQESTLTFGIPNTAVIKDKSGKLFKLSEIQFGNRVSIDYIKESDGRFTAQTITVSGLVGAKAPAKAPK